MIGTRKHSFYRLTVALALYAVVHCPTLLRAEFDGDVRSWQALALTVHDSGQWRVQTTAQTRLYDDSKFLGTWLFKPTVEYKVHPNLNLGGSYLLEDVRAEAGDDFTRLHIFWLHAAPHWKLNDRLSVSMRHVVGLRAIESADNYWISRHRFGLNYKLDECGPLIGIGADTELIYDYKTDRFYENRLKPLKLTFSVNEKMKLSLYLMAQFKRFDGRESWDSAYVLGQSLSVRF